MSETDAASAAARLVRSGDSAVDAFLRALDDRAIYQMALAINRAGRDRHGWAHAFCVCGSCRGIAKRCWPEAGGFCPKAGTTTRCGNQETEPWLTPVCSDHAVERCSAALCADSGPGLPKEATK